MRLLNLIPFTLLSGLTACATIVSGTTQEIAVDSAPEGANCKVLQGGLQVGEVPRTPGYVRVEKSGAGLQIMCSKPGYQAAQSAQSSGFNGWIVGNVLIGGLIGVVVDVASGAVHRYDSSMTVALGGNGFYQPPVANSSSGSQTAYAYNAVSQVSAQSLDEQRFYAATGRSLPKEHGLIRLPPATPGGDYTFIWPTSPTTE